MAKVQGPLFSQSASGSFGGALVFSNTKGRNVVRTKVTPANPMTQAQMDVRNRQRVSAVAQAWANASAMMGEARAVTDKEALRAVTPSGQSWNAYFVKSLIGTGGLNYAAAETAWAALAAPDVAAWQAAAAALTPAYLPVAQKSAGNVAAAPLDAGFAWFAYQYGLYYAGVASVPSAVPPVYA